MSIASLIAAMVFAVPGFADELRRSTDRMPRQYLELSFVDPAAAVACVAPDGQLRLDVAVRSHLVHAARLQYEVVVRPRSARPRDVTAGEVRLRAGGSAVVHPVVTVPRRGSYDVSVVLEDRPERLLIHCRGVDA